MQMLMYLVQLDSVMTLKRSGTLAGVMTRSHSVSILTFLCLEMKAMAISTLEPELIH